jgi:hypothetical protein
MLDDILPKSFGIFAQLLSAFLRYLIRYFCGDPITFTGSFGGKRQMAPASNTGIVYLAVFLFTALFYNVISLVL